MRLEEYEGYVGEAEVFRHMVEEDGVRVKVLQRSRRKRMVMKPEYNMRRPLKARIDLLKYN